MKAKKDKIKKERTVSTKEKKRLKTIGIYIKEYLEAGGKETETVTISKYKRSPKDALSYAVKKVKARKQKQNNF